MATSDETDIIHGQFCDVYCRCYAELGGMRWLSFVFAKNASARLLRQFNEQLLLQFGEIQNVIQRYNQMARRRSARLRCANEHDDDEAALVPVSVRQLSVAVSALLCCFAAASAVELLLPKAAVGRLLPPCKRMAACAQRQVDKYKWN